MVPSIFLSIQFELCSDLHQKCRNSTATPLSECEKWEKERGKQKINRKIRVIVRFVCAFVFFLESPEFTPDNENIGEFDRKTDKFYSFSSIELL